MYSKKGSSAITLIHDLDGRGRWDIYINQIKESLDNHRSVIILLPDINSALKAKEIISAKFNYPLAVLYSKQPKGLKEWINIKQGKIDIVIGSRSAIFAPLSNLGLIIIDEEQNSVYKQEQVPHYHAREVAFTRINKERAKLILASSSPTLESFYLAKKNKIRYIFIPRKRDFPEIKIMDMKYFLSMVKNKKIIFSKYLEDAITQTLNNKGKILLFLNRRGFATFISCNYCGAVLKCNRCNVNLVYHFKENILRCHHCNFKTQPVALCPNCNSGYIRYSGAGTEKIESELARLFPQAKIKRLDSLKGININAADIFISTESIFKEANYNFDLIGVLSIDNSLNRFDFRASEKTFNLLIGLLRFTEKTIVIQTTFPNHHCFNALRNKDTDLFYTQELKQRRQLQFPPYQHTALVKIRGKDLSRVQQVSTALFERMKKYSKNKTIKIISVNPAHPSKLREKFWWQILLKSNSAQKMTKFLKIHLKNLSHSGIIVTVDIDPI